jgi:flagellar basal-body rod modification protein FlgD
MSINAANVLNLLNGVNQTLTTVNKIKADVTQSPNNKTGQTAAAQNTASGSDMFLKLLVEQLKNQDPLAPQDGTQFVAQLAQFNSLEQLININRQIAQLVQASGKK